MDDRRYDFCRKLLAKAKDDIIDIFLVFSFSVVNVTYTLLFSSLLMNLTMFWKLPAGNYMFKVNNRNTQGVKYVQC